MISRRRGRSPADSSELVRLREVQSSGDVPFHVNIDANIDANVDVNGGFESSPPTIPADASRAGLPATTGPEAPRRLRLRGRRTVGSSTGRGVRKQVKGKDSKGRSRLYEGGMSPRSGPAGPAEARRAHVERPRRRRLREWPSRISTRKSAGAPACSTTFRCLTMDIEEGIRSRAPGSISINLLKRRRHDTERAGPFTCSFA